MLLFLLQQTGRLAWWAAAAYVIFTASRWAFEFRLHSITNYGSVIHEFDPYFNFRATQYVLYTCRDRLQAYTQTRHRREENGHCANICLVECYVCVCVCVTAVVC